jgi:formylglycine-generating enzyme required for sulfatase activity
MNNPASEAVKDAYQTARQAIIKKLGNAKAIDALETDPDSGQNRAWLAEALAAEEASEDPEINRLTRQLIQTLQETEAGRKAVSRYFIEAAGAQLGVVGNGTCIEGGIHFHQHPSSEESKSLGTPQDFKIAIKGYLKSAEALYENLPLMGFRTKLRVPIRIEEIYVPLRAMVDLRATGPACFADAEDAEKKLGRAGACDDIALPEAFSRAGDLHRRGIVILGDPGSGKTTHLKRLLLGCLRQGPDELSLPAGIIPVFLPLRELSDLEQGLDAFIQAQLDNPHLGTPPGFGRQLVARGNLLFLLDGLDEVADPDQRIRVARWIDAALTVHRNCWFVVTCRFAGYTDQARLCEQFLEMHLRPLSFDLVKTFVDNWYRIVETGLSKDRRQAEVIAKERARDLIDKLGQPEFRARRVFELTRNPLLLANLCLVHRDRGNLPHDRARLYEECTDVLLELWRAAIGYQARVDARSSRKILQPAAFWLHQEEGRTRAKAEELAPVIEPALKDAGWPHGSAEEFLQVVRDESGLLTGWDQEHYGFMHLGFQEYLAARQIQNNFYLDPKVISDLADQFGQSWWQEVTLLLLCLENPCLFIPFMRELVQRPGFTQHPDLVEMCLDDAVEKPALPFLELLQTKPGKDPALWQRQLAALKLIERLDNDALNKLAPQLARHPYDKIRQRVDQRKIKAAQEIVFAPRGGYELVRIPGGEFLMGSPDSEEERDKNEGPQHPVRVPDFYLGRYPVTNEEYSRFLSENSKAPEPAYWADRQYNQPRQSVVGVSWEDARQYAHWAGLQLPSEAQWEYACRAGTRTPYYTGDTQEDLDRAGWYDKNSGGMLHPVGQKEPNVFGLYDMHGNVWEWIEDDYHENYDGAPNDGRAWIDEPKGSLYRVLRGGSWVNFVGYCRAAHRGWFEPSYRTCFTGFRLAMPQVSRGEQAHPNGGPRGSRPGIG